MCRRRRREGSCPSSSSPQPVSFICLHVKPRWVPTTATAAQECIRARAGHAYMLMHICRYAYVHICFMYCALRATAPCTPQNRDPYVEQKRCRLQKEWHKHIHITKDSTRISKTLHGSKTLHIVSHPTTAAMWRSKRPLRR